MNGLTPVVKHPGNPYKDRDPYHSPAPKQQSESGDLADESLGKPHFFLHWGLLASFVK